MPGNKSRLRPVQLVSKVKKPSFSQRRSHGARRYPRPSRSIPEPVVRRFKAGEVSSGSVDGALAEGRVPLGDHRRSAARGPPLNVAGADPIDLSEGSIEPAPSVGKSLDVVFHLNWETSFPTTLPVCFSGSVTVRGGDATDTQRATFSFGLNRFRLGFVLRHLELCGFGECSQVVGFRSSWPGLVAVFSLKVGQTLRRLQVNLCLVKGLLVAVGEQQPDLVRSVAGEQRADCRAVLQHDLNRAPGQKSCRSRCGRSIIRCALLGIDADCPPYDHQERSGDSTDRARVAMPRHHFNVTPWQSQESTSC